MRVIQPFATGLNELHTVIIEGKIQRQELALERLMMNSDENPPAFRITLDLVEENRRIRLIAGIDFGDRSHVQYPSRSLDSSSSPNSSTF